MEAFRMEPRQRPLDPSAADRRQTALAQRWRHMRDGLPSALYLLACAVVIIVVGVLVGMLLAKVLSHTGLGRADADADRWFARNRTPGWNTITLWAAEAGGTPVVAGLAVLSVAVTAFVWRRWREPAMVGAAVLGEVLMFLAITTLVHRPRPPVSHLDAAPPTSSFPSGHTAAAVVLYGAWAVLANERARSALVRGLLIALAVIAPIAVGLARLYRGMHFPTDVIAGALLGLVWLPLVARAVRLGVVHHDLREGQPGRPSRAMLRPNG
jgi:membrane-associated phospholipid phosphatase